MKKIGNIKNFFNKTTIIICCIILILLAFIIAFFFKGDEIGNKKIKYEDYTIYEGHTGKIEKYDPSMTVDGYRPSENAYYIIGKISAKEDKKFSVITFNLYDEDDKLLGTAVAGLNVLKKDEVYEFKALGLIEGDQVLKVDHYELKSVELG